MSYRCYATNEVVINESRELVPIKIRKVNYIAQIKPDPKSDYLQFASQTEGWEIVEEVPIRKSKVDEFKASHSPIIVPDVKEVRYTKPNKPKEKYNKHPNRDEDYKPEELD